MKCTPNNREPKMIQKPIYKLTGFRGVVKVTNPKTKQSRLFKVFVSDDFAAGETLVAVSATGNIRKPEWSNFAFVNQGERGQVVSVFKTRRDNPVYNFYKQCLQDVDSRLQYEVLEVY